MEDYAGNAFSGNVSVEIYNSDDLSSEMVLITPELLDIQNADHRIRFMAKAAGTDPAVIVGTMSDPTDYTTFTPFAGVTLTTEYTEYYVNVDAPPAGHNYIAIQHGNGATYQTIRIDDFAWEPIPACLEPTEVVVSDITSTDVTVTWIENNTTPATEWEYVIQDQGTGEPVAAGTNTTDNPVTGTSLSPNTAYERRLCIYVNIYFYTRLLVRR